MAIFGTLVLAVVVVALLLTVQTSLLGDEDLNYGDPRVYVEPVLIGLVVGVVNYVSPLLKDKALWAVPLLFMLVMMGLFVYLAYWWSRGGTELIELVCFSLLAILFCLAMSSACAAFVAAVPNFATLTALPPALAVAAIGYFVADFFFLRYKESEDKGSEKLHGALTLAAAVLTVALVIGITGSALTVNPKKAAKSAKTSVAEATTVAEAEASGEAEAATVEPAEPRFDEGKVVDAGYVSAGWAHYYNADIQDDGKADNDFNFGPNPWIDGGDAHYYNDDFAAWRAKDPALLAATMVALDCTLGTDFIGEVLYEGYDERLNMLEKADAAARVLDGDRELFNLANEAVNRLLSSRVSLKLKKMYDINDQLFMNPATLSGIPGIVFYQANFDKGWCLVYEFRIKSGSNTKAQVIFHIPCGYQWADAAEKLDVEPEKMPESKSKSSSSKSSGGKSSSSKKKKSSSDKGSKSESSKTTKKTTKITKDKKTSTEKFKRPDEGPKYDKDPNDAPSKNTEPNDDKGPGPNTNSGGDKSTKDQDTNSTSKKNYDDYKKDIEETKKVNEEQKKGGDSNEPSTKPKDKDTKSDNNGDSGSGHGGSDAPTPTKEKEKTADGSKITKDKKDGGTGAWAGPSD